MQKRLLGAIDDSSDNYTALPEFRCTFGGRSIVPDIAVIAWNRIQLNDREEPVDDFLEAPSWAIEILSPKQQATRVIDNLLHYLQYGCQLGWLLDPDDYSVLIFTPQRELQICRGDRALPVLDDIHLTLTAEQVFAWLKLQQRS